MAYFKCKGRMYRWQKWTSKEQYAQASQSYTYGGAITWASLQPYPCSIYGAATAYSYDVDTGKYNLSGGVTRTVSSAPVNPVYFNASSTNRYHGWPHQGTSCDTILEQPSGFVDMYYHNYQTSFNSSGTTIKRYSVQNGYAKGDTLVGIATSLKKDTYPTNGRYAEDGYWYVAV